MARTDSVTQIAHPAKRFQAVLSRVSPGDIAIDCGANVGDVTDQLLAVGCVVYAFEPDPMAFDVLRQRFGADTNAVIQQVAVGAKCGQQRLYFHRNRANPDANITVSQSSSLLVDKSNISKRHFVEVDVVDLGRFIAELGSRITILKVDIEGMEADILEMILERKLYDRFEYAFFETHERNVPSARAKLQHIRSEIERLALDHIFLDWK